MSQFRVLVATLAAALGWSGVAAAGPMLTGTVAYDRSTQLYTYSYTLDDRTAPAPVDVVLIRVATHVVDVVNLSPVGHTAPAPFTDFHLASAGSIGGEEVFPSGTAYVWEAGWYQPVGAGVHNGFSFTSRYGPGTEGAANYELFSTYATEPPFNRPDVRSEVGWVVAPDLTHAPEPGTLVLGFTGLMVVGWRAFRKQKSGFVTPVSRLAEAIH